MTSFTDLSQAKQWLRRYAVGDCTILIESIQDRVTVIQEWRIK